MRQGEGKERTGHVFGEEEDGVGHARRVELKVRRLAFLRSRNVDARLEGRVRPGAAGKGRNKVGE